MSHALIIEDNHLNIEILSMLLNQQSVTCTAIDSARHIGQTLDQLEKLDVIFLDLEFPTSNGFKVLETLRADARLKGVPIVAYTVHTSELDVARRAGFDSFLGKPLDAHRFPEQLRRILSGQPVWEV